MSTTSVTSSPTARVQAILAQQSKVGRPSPQICAVIAGLRDLCELQGAGGGLDWRRGAGGGGAPSSLQNGGGGGGGGNGFRGARDGGRPLFRNASGNSLPLSSPIHKSGSQQSFGARSTGGAGSPASPVTPSPNPGRYQSMFKNTTQQVEDKILNNIILSKLNKFSGNTYNDIRDFLYQILGSGEPDLAEMIRDFMLLVFKKAAAEEVYCPLYAKLLSEISARYAVILEEMRALQANYMEIFEDVVEVPEGGDNYAVFVEKNKEKQYRQGYSQFLAECAALELLELSSLEATFRKLLDLMVKYGGLEDKKSLVEEYADCLLRMSKVLRKKPSVFLMGARQAVAAVAGGPIAELIERKDAFPSLSPKARFILMDVRDNVCA